jgi:hypothetical protein
MAEIAQLMTVAVAACLMLACAAWLMSRGRAFLGIPPVLKRARLARTTAAATLLLAAVAIGALAAVIAVSVRFLG